LWHLLHNAVEILQEIAEDVVDTIGKAKEAGR
jgi:hypothetical protein